MTLCLVTMLGMITAQGNQLLADRAGIVQLSFAAHSVSHDTFHLMACVVAAIGILALTGMNQRGNTPLDGLAS